MLGGEQEAAEAREGHASKHSGELRRYSRDAPHTARSVGRYVYCGRRARLGCATMTASPIGTHAGLTGHEPLCSPIWAGSAASEVAPPLARRRPIAKPLLQLGRTAAAGAAARSAARG